MPATATDRTTTMKAVVRSAYCPPDGLEVEEVSRPDLPADGVLVRVHASSVNPADWYGLSGTPYVGRVAMGLRRPRQRALGTDFAGTVEAVGGAVTQFRPGDEVFGGRSGAFAEYVCVPEHRAIVLKPSNLTFEQAAAVPIAALTALQGLRDKGQVEAGQKVLINGASGGVGTFAVQIAKAFGAEVTGVCSTRNVDLVRSIGADHVIDYLHEDFTRSGRRYDVMFDVAGSRSWSECKRVLEPKAIVVMVGAPKGNRVLGPLSHVAKVRVASLGSSQKAVFFIAKFNKPDLVVLQELLASGKVTPVVERSYELDDIGEALRYLGEGHAQGKIAVTV